MSRLCDFFLLLELDSEIYMIKHLICLRITQNISWNCNKGVNSIFSKKFSTRFDKSLLSVEAVRLTWSLFLNYGCYEESNVESNILYHALKKFISILQQTLTFHFQVEGGKGLKQIMAKIKTSPGQYSTKLSLSTLQYLKFPSIPMALLQSDE